MTEGNMQYLDMEGLKLYDSLIKAKIETDIKFISGEWEESVKKQVGDAIAKIVADAPEAYDTLKEISDWISSHADDASAINSQISINKADIATLKTLIGTLPETAESTTIVSYIAWAIGELQTELVDTITVAKSEAISSAAADAAIKAAKALADAKEYTDVLIDGLGNVGNYQALAINGDAKDTTVSFTSADIINPAEWTDCSVVVSGEKHSVLWNKASIFFKNIRYLRKLIGSTDISIIADGTITGAISKLNTKVNYRDISEHISFTDDGFRVEQCYVNNGIVCLAIRISVGATAGAHYGTINVEYAPKEIISGSFSEIGTAADANICIGKHISGNGSIVVWLARDALGYGFLTFTYPLNVNGR